MSPHTHKFCPTVITLPQWEVGKAQGREAIPERFVPAVVPGAVQLDFARAENFPDYHFADNARIFAPYEDFFYTYRTRFEAPTLGEGERLCLVCKGLDYQCELFLNGAPLLRHEGMFSAIECDLTAHLAQQNELTIVVHPAPKRADAPIPRAQADHVTKPAVSYGWDWHPRLIPLGIWDETFLEVRPKRFLADFWSDYTLDENLDRARIRVKISGDALVGCRAQWRLLDKSGACVCEQSGTLGDEGTLPEFVFERPHLWWTHDHGDPYLYTAVLRMSDESGKPFAERRARLGFRRIRLVPNEGAWDIPPGFPKSRSPSPAQFELNGRAIFAKGSNWVNPEIFPGLLNRERYDALLSLAQKAHFNCLRVWGGGVVNKESFFDLADEKGLLIWQEFPLACNLYPDDAHYLRILEQEATAVILRLKKHACLALWCGGNELFNSWSKMTEQSLPLRLLDALTFRLDPTTPYNHTSPLMDMAHGHYLFRDMGAGEEVFQIINRARNTAYTEFGVPGAASVETLKRIIPAEELFPPRDTPAWRIHHGFKAWKPDRNEWLCPESVAFYFGESKNLDEFVARSQLMQAQGYKAVFEEARRQKPYCAMALNWCYNEPWPCAANNSLLSHPAEEKPAYAAVAQSCRPVCLSARFQKFLWREGEIFSCEIFLLNDSYENLPGSSVRVTLKLGAFECALLDWNHAAPEPNRNLQGPTARIRLPRQNADRMTIRLEDAAHPERDSQYVLAYRPAEAPAARNTSMN